MKKEIKDINKITKENLPERIEKAKRLAQEDYIKTCDRLGIHNPNYKRNWKRCDQEKKGNYMFVLEGTPDKAFVFVDEESNSVVAVKSNGTKIKEL